MNQQYELATADRAEFVYDIGKLAVPSTITPSYTPPTMLPKRPPARRKRKPKKQPNRPTKRDRRSDDDPEPD